LIDYFSFSYGLESANFIPTMGGKFDYRERIVFTDLDIMLISKSFIHWQANSYLMETSSYP